MDSTRAIPEPPEAAITQLVRDYGGRIFSLGLQLCGSREDAEDLVQETFLRAFRGWKNFRGAAAPSTWLHTIAVRVCQRRHRRRAGEPRRIESLSSLLPADEEGIVDLADPDPGPLEGLLRRESEEAVQRALSKIPVHFRLPLVLKDIAEFSIADTARILGIKEATAKTRVHRARLYIARELRKELPRRASPPLDHTRRVCLDLLQAKQDALDNGVPFPLAADQLCSRCRSLFATLDLGRDACQALQRGDLPEPLRRALLDEFSHSPRHRSL